MKALKVSVVIPFYNVEKYIYDCARSLFQQTLLELEFIFIDDCSTDNSLEELKRIIQEYPERKVVLISHTKNRGIAASRNEGIARAQGEYIGFVDSDDWVDPDMFEKLYNEAFERKADIVWCDYIIEGKDSKSVIQINLSEDNIIDFMHLYLMNSINHLWNMLVHRNLYVRNHLRFLDGYDMCEDLNVSTKLYYYSNRSYHLPIPLYHYRDNATSICHTINKRNYIARLENVLELHEFFKEKDIYNDIKKVLFYRILLFKQFYLYTEKDVTKYVSICSEANTYIWSNPFYGIKAKCIEWLTVHLYSIIIKLSNIKI